jgi:hypothetical protein
VTTKANSRRRVCWIVLAGAQAKKGKKNIVVLGQITYIKVAYLVDVFSK